MQVTIHIPAVPRSRTGAREIVKIIPSEDELWTLLNQTTGAILPVTFQLKGGARITFDD